MTVSFLPAYTNTIGLEGNYSNNPGDPGGPTRFGITQKEARTYGYTGDMQDFPIETAQMIYKAGYWNPLGLDNVTDQSVANKMFDGSVNCGVQTMAGWVQRILNALGKTDGTDIPLWPLVIVDDDFGPSSMAALNTCIAHSPQYLKVLLESINCLQGASYIDDTEKNAHLREFYFGWISNRITI